MVVCLAVLAVIDWRRAQVVPGPSPRVSWDKRKYIMDERTVAQ